MNNTNNASSEQIVNRIAEIATLLDAALDGKSIRPRNHSEWTSYIGGLMREGEDLIDVLEVRGAVPHVRANNAAHSARSLARFEHKNGQTHLETMIDAAEIDLAGLRAYVEVVGSADPRAADNAWQAKLEGEQNRRRFELARLG